MIVLSVSTLAAVGGCSPAEAPTGQVVATVNGTEVTLGELNEEARARNLNLAQDRRLRDLLVQELVDRKLLVQDAIDQGFDRSAQYLLAKRRSDEILLGQLMLTSAAQAWTPTSQDVQQHISANPHAFDQRTLLVVDVLDVPRHVPQQVQRAIATAPTLELMESELKRAGITGARSIQSWDSASLPESWRKLLLPLQPGTAFVLPSTGGAITGRLLTRIPQPVPASQRPSLAREALNRSRMEAILKQILRSKRLAAEVRYHREFAPRTTTDEQ